MKPSARNQLKGRITNILRGATTSHITIDVNSTLITSVMIGVD
ncbi:TOBE domain-containing protein [Gluconobacter sphaericus]|nr:TOBE domain-containing protein [Gluconobacter sphaericus]MBF0885791.1 TOBE domain-containing protein [Gluconobacter sphaericus]MBS1086541.1 TOBE domain-containing protein [Gluconobacter sphaericus]MBS1100581.1 TOBE domain-containing protein [Gluconobacter sphaericus]